MRLDIANIVSSAFEIIGDLRENTAVQLVATNGAYDPVTDSTTQTITTINDLKAVFSRFTIDEVDESVVVSTDMKVLIPAKDLNYYQPQEYDTLIETDTSVKWNVRKSRTVPGNSLYIVHVRKA